MNELQIFEHPKFGKIRTIVEDGKTMFCGSDAASALGYASPDGAIRRHCRYPLKQRVWVQTGMKADGNPAMRETEMTFITDGDLCRLAAKSELPGANEFESWIFDEVIPSVLRTGTYSITPKILQPPPEVSPGGLAKLILATRKVVLEAGGTPLDVRAVTQSIFETWHIPVPPELSKQLPGQLSLFDTPALKQ